MLSYKSGYIDKGTRLLLLASVVVISTFWGLRTWQSLMIDNTASRRRLIPQVFPIGGLRVSADAIVGQPAPSVQSGRTLLIFTSDTCSPSRLELPKWRHLMSSLAFKPGDEIVVANIGDNGPHELLAEAARLGVPVRVLTVRDIPRWVAGTGLSSTPATAVLDRNGRFQLVLHVLSEEDLDLLSMYFNAETTEEFLASAAGA